MVNKITSNTILNLLLKKHNKDICVPECKAGSSWSDEKTPRFDLWAMKRSYAKPMTWIYEIKVSRQDFLKDDKWQSYLPYCTDFYFVAPPGIIDIKEVPEQSGLLLISKTGTKLYCKKKAPHRNVTIPDSVFKYILMSRTEIVNSTYGNVNNGMDMQSFWQDWLKKKDIKQQLGHRVSRKIRSLYNENVKLVQIQQKQLEYKIEKFENVKKILKELGFNSENIGWNYKQRIIDRISEINEGFPEKSVIKHLESSIVNLKNTITVIKKQTENRRQR